MHEIEEEELLEHALGLKSRQVAAVAAIVATVPATEKTQTAVSQ
jgi:hypothetical protein